MSYKRHKQFRHGFNVNHYFGKKYEFTENETYLLPKSIYLSKKWIIPVLQDKKFKLNEIKGQLSDFDLQEWSKHTKLRDPSSFIIKFLKKQFNPELLTQAWCKFYECLSTYNIVPEEAILSGSISSVHLCEAPGGFVSALNHYLVLNHPEVKWQWIGSTLNPEYEGNPLNHMIPDDRLICCTPNNWHFGADWTGDITKYYNHVDLINRSKQLDKVWIVTADGSIDCMSNPGDQELTVQNLHYCEAMTALAVLEPGGSFVIKMFTTFEESTICLLYLLNCAFQKVQVFKPSSSKSGNSEVYVVCLKYKGTGFLSSIWKSLLVPYKSQGKTNNSMFDLYEINEHFIRQIIACSNFFMEKQIFTITENIKYFKNKSSYQKSKNYELKTFVANHFILKYKLNGILSDKKIVPVGILEFAKFYKRFWSWGEKWTFKKNYVVLNVVDVIATSGYDYETHFCINVGKQLDKVIYSSFCADVNRFCPIISRTNYTISLYNTILSNISKFSVVINAKDIPSNLPQHKFQKLLFEQIKNNLCSKNIIFVGFMFATGFLISLLFILMSAFKQICFYRGGLIVLLDPDKEKLMHVIKVFNTLEETRSCILNNNFEADIVSVISLSQLKENDFFYALWQYNNSLLLEKNKNI